MTESCLYEGSVRHRRFGTVAREFSYDLFMAYLDLDELPEVLDAARLWSARRAAPAWFRRADFLGDPAKPLGDATRDLVEERTGRRPDGPVRLLAHLRYLGHCFNPVSFLYCFGRDGRRIEAVVAEVTNTPWRERHAYVLTADPACAGGDGVTQRFDKAMHVSPFMGMDHRYELRLGEPGSRLLVNIESRGADGPAFDATLSMQRREISGPALDRMFLRRPAMTLRVLSGIYGQALRLRLRGAPVHGHPRRAAHGAPVSPA
jgi:DUF1365 family protein